MKRSFREIFATFSEPIAQRTRSKKPKLVSPLESISNKTLPWVAASKTSNYILKDTLVDWLSFYGREQITNTSNNSRSQSLSTFLKEKGVEFEREVVSLLNKRHLVESITFDYYCASRIEETLDCMKRGIPIIHSAPISNSINRTFGIADLLVRSDYLHNIISDCPISAEERNIPAPLLNHPYHYVIIDIKYSTLPLTSDGIHILNNGRFSAYKSQLLVYTQAVGKMQGYTPNKAYILGRRWKYTQKDQIFKGSSCLDKLGVIDYSGRDSKYIELTKKAINWYQDVIRTGAYWTLNPPSRRELYPNMCQDSGMWNTTKEKIAKELGEITMLWNCGVKNREIAFSNDIKSWKDKDCIAERLGIHSENYKKIVNSIIQINRQDEVKILPPKIGNNLFDWKKFECNELFIDFELYSDIFLPLDSLPFQKEFNVIFMIGVGWSKNGKWNYKNFISKYPTLDEEFRIMEEFSNFVDSKGNPSMYYWHAEESFWKRSSNTQFERLNISNYQKSDIINYWDHYTWKDLSKVFKSEPIVVKDVFNFGLKNIFKKMREFGMINTKLESECKSGSNAMVSAYKCYSNYSDPITSPIMKDISHYNEFDCKVIYDIINYLRKNHT